MQVVNKKMCVVVILMLVIIESCTLFLMYKSFSNKNTNLDEVNLNKEINNNMFAIMLEQDDGTYKEDSTNTWPTSGYTYNESMSGCIDINGNKLDGVLSYDSANNIATVDTGNTSYCYLYFSLLPYMCDSYENAASCLINETEMWDSTLEEDGYRYVGTNPNNYICFGTTDKSECTKNTDVYMYRIIGIFEDSEENQHLKLIKKDALNTGYAWHNDETVDIDWDESDLYNGINGNYFLNNTTYSYMQDNLWQGKITAWDWIVANSLYFAEVLLGEEGTGITYSFNNSETIYLHEMNRTSKSTKTCVSYSTVTTSCSEGKWKTVEDTKIGLIYVSDYTLSLGEISLNYIPNSNYETLKTGWVYLNNNDSGAPSGCEWTMTRHAYYESSSYYYPSSYNSYCILTSESNAGSLPSRGVTSLSPVRPVFYLTTYVKITGGTGTEDDPFIIK